MTRWEAAVACSIWDCLDSPRTLEEIQYFVPADGPAVAYILGRLVECGLVGKDIRRDLAKSKRWQHYYWRNDGTGPQSFDDEDLPF